MSFDGTGTYNLVAGLEANLANGQTNDGTEVYAAFADVATALSTCITKNGQTTIAADIPMSGYKITGLAAGSTTGDSLRYEQLFTASTVTLTGGLVVGNSSGVLQFPDGSVSAPGLRVGSSSTTGLFSNTDNSLRAATNGVEAARFIATGLFITAGSISFPSTQAASTDPNTLDDYEEGTWTPALTFSTPGNLSVTLDSAVGAYRKIGSQVIVTCDIATSAFSHSTASGNLHITGLPFTSANTSGQTHSGACQIQGVTKASYTDYMVRLGANSAIALIGASGSGQQVSNVTAPDMPTGGDVIIRFTLAFNV
jgi:hypothetical protein